MSKIERYLHHAANLLVGGSGLVYGWMLYFATPSEEFSVWNHPWQGAVHDLHLLLAPMLVLTFGILWKGHSGARLRDGIQQRRVSGLGMLFTFLPMLCSGYLLQVTVEESWRTIWLWIHLGCSGLWLCAYLIHWISRAKGEPEKVI